jgi:ribosome-associated protein
MDIKKLQRAIVDGLEDVKAQHIAVFNTEHLSSMFERVIVASGTSNRQTKALAASVRDSVKSRGMQVLSTEGEDNGEWIIVDCGAAVAHIMQPAIREYYHLEEIWGGKAVRMKLGDTTTRLVKASEPEPEARPAARSGAKTAARKEPSRTVATRKAPAKKVVAKRAANQAAAFKRVAAKKVPARKTAATKAPVRKRISRA